MNSLSWIIYGAETVGKMGSAAGLLSIAFGVVALGALIVGSVIRGEAYGETKEETVATGKKVQGYTMPLLVTSLCMVGLTVFVPSTQALYLIGASQVGEQIIQLQEVQDIGGEAGALATDTIKLLREMVSEQLDAGGEQ